MSNKTVKLEEYLKRGVAAAGLVVEKIIGEADKLKSSISKSSGGAQPILSLEGQISIPKLKELIATAADKIITIPNLVDKTALELREGRSSLTAKLKERGASFSVHADMAGTTGSYEKPTQGSYTIRGSSHFLPFEDGFFDYIIGNLASQYQGDITKAIKELSRLLILGGEGVIVDFHPFGLYAKRGSVRLRPMGFVTRGIEDYYKICKSVQLKILDLKEGFLDESMRASFVTEGEKSAFRIVKDTPLILCLFVKKGG